MTLTIQNTTGDGVLDTLIQSALELPDSGTSVNIVGQIQAAGKSKVAITGSPLTMPTAPASGTIYWNVQIDVTTGAATVQQSTSVDPAPINGNNVVVFRQSLVPGNANPAAVSTDSTPDDY